MIQKREEVGQMEKFPSSLRKEIVHRLVAEFEPEEIYLFGSHAWGVPNLDSDLDFMVIVSESQQPALERARRVQRCLRGVLAPVDVLVKTRAEFERYRPVRASLEAKVYEKGKLVYGRETPSGENLAHQS
jgi:predicted nucleotidyltransferase